LDLTVPVAIPTPKLQIDFAFALEQIRATYLQDALSAAVGLVAVATIDAELAKFVSPASLTKLAGRGLRGELMFAVPSVLRADPHLLGYYRLLLGFSQKAFYTKQFGTIGLKPMEMRGTLSVASDALLDSLCSGMSGASAALLDGVGVERLSLGLLDDLALLTVGPQLRGGNSVAIGLAGIRKVFDAVAAIVAHATVKTGPNFIDITNAAGRRVLIQFASDPDIIIREEMTAASLRNIIAIEVKAGMDFSNIHNRIGEAEKSHQKAKRAGYVECWTVVNVDRIDMAMAHRESPSTNRFYRISDIASGSGDDFHDFANRVISLTGIASLP
jgi:hypothetical protein